ncbi:MAG: carbonate dehydratase [Gammaproteobacteria bacterium]|nr:carbonate dehydratase [Gammaproteobacteria bacterium]MDH5629282.1 carbonate dehydratase [Gammaproteobacteria bacterium]
MSQNIQQLLENNQAWVKRFEKENPGIFEKLSHQQNPEYLWIGCSDSRVPANTIVGLQPGEVFVHRNVANLVNYTDFNLLSVLEYAVNVLGVSDIILCGHYGCGGVMAAMESQEHGLVDNWLRSIKDIYRENKKAVDALSDSKAQVNLLCELNVKQQVKNLSHTSIVQNAWNNGTHLTIHGVIYSIEDGLLKDMQVSISSIDEVDRLYQLV